MGGPSTLANGTTICGGHHAATHEGLLEITGPAPYIKVKWLVPSESPIEDEEMRKALLEREIDSILHRTHVPRGTSPPRVSHDDVKLPPDDEAVSTAATPPPD